MYLGYEYPYIFFAFLAAIFCLWNERGAGTQKKNGLNRCNHVNWCKFICGIGSLKRAQNYHYYYTSEKVIMILFYRSLNPTIAEKIRKRMDWWKIMKNRNNNVDIFIFDAKKNFGYKNKLESLEYLDIFLHWPNYKRHNIYILRRKKLYIYIFNYWFNTYIYRLKYMY